uniref:leucine--tRNA ligase n=1 Tax=Pseudacidovorax intermedius TaxID=433924 RepID=UPI0005BD35D4
LKITDYAEELLDHVQHKLPGWPERVRLMQENWIGKSSGVRFAFTHDIRGADGAPIQDGRMYVFTTRADTIMGVTFCAVAPEHPLATHAAQSDPKVAAFIAECKAGGVTEAELATQEKKGVPTGLTVTHPITDEQVPVWVGNYVLMSYGDGAVMGVPAHDERDFAFANKYGIPIVQVVLVDDEPHFDFHKWQDWYADKERGVTINSDNFSGMRYQEAVDAVAHALEEKGLGAKKTTWRLRDWGISRQRYWGTPIPIIHCPDCGPVPVPEQDLPVVLPTDCVPDGSGNPLNKREDFLACTCPTCGKPARRETDTMDTFVDSSWYFMRYCDPANDQAMVADGARYWMRGQGNATGGSGMDQYIGGIEHAILHLLYARFWTKVMRDLGLVTIDEPFTRLLTQGMVLNHIYYKRNAKGGKDYFPPAEVTPTLDAQGRITGGTTADGTVVEYGGVGKMGKSERNGVDPQELIEKYGADTARLYTMFTAPPEATLEWNDAAVEGSFRFLRRVWNFGQALAAMPAADGAAPGKAAKALRREVHTVLRQVDYDYQRMQYNTVVSGAMKLLNALEGFKAEGEEGGVAALREGFGILLRVLYPVTPHLTHQLWKQLGYADAQGLLLDAPWPVVDESALAQDEVELMLQINGKLRGAVVVPAGADKAEIEALAVASEAFTKHANGQAVKRVIVVPGRLVNVVVA